MGKKKKKTKNQQQHKSYIGNEGKEEWVSFSSVVLNCHMVIQIVHFQTLAAHTAMAYSRGHAPCNYQPNYISTVPDSIITCLQHFSFKL